MYFNIIDFIRCKEIKIGLLQIIIYKPDCDFFLWKNAQ